MKKLSLADQIFLKKALFDYRPKYYSDLQTGADFARANNELTTAMYGANTKEYTLGYLVTNELVKDDLYNQPKKDMITVRTTPAITAKPYTHDEGQTVKVIISETKASQTGKQVNVAAIPNSFGSLMGNANTISYPPPPTPPEIILSLEELEHIVKETKLFQQKQIADAAKEKRKQELATLTDAENYAKATAARAKKAAEHVKKIKKAR